MSVEAKNLYKVYRNGVYLGLLPNVISEFNYQQDINTAGTEIEIEVAQTLDTANEPVEPIEDQNGVPLLTENERIITTERSTQIVGNKDSGLLIANGNDVEVWEYTDSNPNGKLAFTGYQSRMRGTVGDGDSLLLTIISNGKDLGDYVYGNSAFTLQTSQAIANDNWRLGNSSQWIGGINTTLRALYQTFSGLNYTINKVRLNIAIGHNLLGIYPASTTFTLGFYSGTPDSGTLLATSSLVSSSLVPTFETADFILSAPVVLSSGTQYYIKIECDDYGDVQIATSDAYAGGGEWIQIGSGAVAQDTALWDLTFGLYSGGLATDATFAAYDPAQMVRDALDGTGTAVTYTGSSIVNSGYSLDYDFITATALEIIEKARELAPADYYWYVDPATQILTFKEVAATATHRFIVGRHISQFELAATIENIKNVVYFTGGPTAGVNLLKLYTQAASLAANRRGLERMADNRILAADEPSAAAIADSFMDERDSEEFLADPLVILASTYDISTINLGDTVSILGLGNFLDSVVLQITSLERALSYAKLTLGKLPLKSDVFVDNIKRKLDTVQTLDNPNAPS